MKQNLALQFHIPDGHKPGVASLHRLALAAASAESFLPRLLDSRYGATKSGAIRAPCGQTMQTVTPVMGAKADLDADQAVAALQ